MPAPIVWHRRGQRAMGALLPGVHGAGGGLSGAGTGFVSHCSTPNSWSPCVLSEICLTFEGWRTPWVPGRILGCGLSRSWDISWGQNIRWGSVCGSVHVCLLWLTCACARGKAIRNSEPAWSAPLKPDPEARSHPRGVAGPPAASEVAVLRRAPGLESYIWL